MTDEQLKLFRNGSVTYFTSSLFFPPAIRNDVTRLYAFVRKADDFVDQTPQDEEGFERFRLDYETAMTRRQKGAENWQSGDFVADDFVALSYEQSFDPAWATAFLDAMEADLHKKTYHTLKEAETYMYGSAEVVGLFLCNILNLSPTAHPAAQSLGKAMQYINFIRDISEDIELGRQYLPVEEMEKFNLKELSKREALGHPKEFSAFVNKQLEHYRQWQKTAETGYALIPKRYRVAVKTAADVYNWTATQIAKNPLIVFEKKIKPKKWYVILTALRNFITA